VKSTNIHFFPLRDFDRDDQGRCQGKLSESMGADTDQRGSMGRFFAPLADPVLHLLAMTSSSMQRFRDDAGTTALGQWKGSGAPRDERTTAKSLTTWRRSRRQGTARGGHTLVAMGNKRHRFRACAVGSFRTAGIVCRINK
jgi:hypothetical protein